MGEETRGKTFQEVQAIVFMNFVKITEEPTLQPWSWKSFSRPSLSPQIMGQCASFKNEQEKKYPGQIP